VKVVRRSASARRRTARDFTQLRLASQHCDVGTTEIKEQNSDRRRRKRA
jgi:hypothetical protein